MQFPLPAEVLKALDMITARGYEAYVVGGCVRDLLMGIPPHDYDICTSALPEETKACFCGERVIETGIQHGTVTVLMNGEMLEITTFRTEGDYAETDPRNHRRSGKRSSLRRHGCCHGC